MEAASGPAGHIHRAEDHTQINKCHHFRVFIFIFISGSLGGLGK